MAKIIVIVRHVQSQMVEDQAQHHQKEISRKKLSIRRPGNHSAQDSWHEAGRGEMEPEGPPPDFQALPAHSTSSSPLKGNPD